ncbi:ribose transport system permease protein [Kitasatospora sp. MAA4]|uniref:ABC transporter permease n=1 Tax=Kitasatospora sp. MAA4 TaxID=3035093 RepID=UPI00247498E4|nr:ABC transporter permease [Kitasatospora sp. MAA4]MDH6137535.1 ribose transport system permease protein [Kitasatospora sp. MAA4]
MSTDTVPAGQREQAASTADGSALSRLARSPEVGVVLACVLLFTGLAIAKPAFAGAVNLQNMGTDLAQYGVIAIGESLVILTGGIDLSVGALLGLSVVLAAWFNVKAGMPAGPAILCTLALTGLVGWIHGLAVTKLAMPPFVTTLVTYTVAQGAALAITSGIPVVGISGLFSDLSQTFVAQVPLPAVLFAVTAVAAWFFLERTYAGRQVYAVGGNKEAARLAGIRGDRRIIAMYVTSSLLAGFGGVLVAGRMGVGSPTVGVGWELSAIAAAVIGGVSLVGGQGRILGIVAGAVLLELINDGMIALAVNADYTNIVLGVVLGLAILADRLRARRLSRRG